MTWERTIKLSVFARTPTHADTHGTAEYVGTYRVCIALYLRSHVKPTRVRKSALHSNATATNLNCRSTKTVRDINRRRTFRFIMRFARDSCALICVIRVAIKNCILKCKRARPRCTYYLYIYMYKQEINNDRNKLIFVLIRYQYNINTY